LTTCDAKGRCQRLREGHLDGTNVALPTYETRVAKEIDAAHLRIGGDLPLVFRANQSWQTALRARDADNHTQANLICDIDSAELNN